MSLERGRELAREMIDTVPPVMQVVASRMRHMDVPMPMPHFRALMVVAHRGQCTMTDLADKARVSLPTMSNTVSVLVERGWAERVVDDADRRRTTVRLTGEGMEAVDHAHRQLEALLGEPLSRLSDEESEQLRVGLEVLRRAFERAAGAAESGAA